MSRRVRCVAMVLSCSVLLVASSQAAPIKALPRESALALESVTGVWEWLVSFLRKTPTVVPRLDSTTAADGYALDPNGGPH